MNIKEIAPKLTQKLSIAINDDEAVEFAEALISAYKAELLKEVGEPVAFVNDRGEIWGNGAAIKPEDNLFTSDQLIAARKGLEEEIERLNRQVDNFNELDRKLEAKASMDLTSMPDAICELRQQLAAAQEETESSEAVEFDVEAVAWAYGKCVALGLENGSMESAMMMDRLKMMLGGY